MRNSSAKRMALGGIFAALAVVIMAMGTLIPVATYVCPVLCMLLLQLLLSICGRATAWAWFGAVSILSALFAPDKEAVIVFVFLGYYPILKPWMDRRKGKLLWKSLFFNLVILSAYWLMINLLGLEQVIRDMKEAGTVMTVLLLILGNITFFLVDRVLAMWTVKFSGRK